MIKNPLIKIYGTESCSYCMAARMLLTKKGVEFDDVLVSHDAGKLDEMIALSGRRSVPQIVIGDRPIGGFDELYTLEQSGELDALIDASNDTLN